MSTAFVTIVISELSNKDCAKPIFNTENINQGESQALIHGNSRKIKNKQHVRGMPTPQPSPAGSHKQSVASVRVHLVQNLSPTHAWHKISNFRAKFIKVFLRINRSPFSKLFLACRADQGEIDNINKGQSLPA